MKSLVLCLLAALGAVDVAAAQDPVERGWKFERLHLVDEVIVEGLLLSEHRLTIEFAVITRPKGRAMQAVIKPFPRSQILRVERLPAQEHNALHVRFSQLKNRARIEADRMEAIQLTPPAVGAPSIAGSPTFPEAKWSYHGDWFDLSTSLDEAAARWCIVRVAQVFRAYRHLIPPRRSADKPLRIMLTGTAAEYRRMMSQLELDTASPALYLPQLNLIIASTDLSPLSRQLAVSAAKHQLHMERQEQKLDSFPEQFAEEAAKLRLRGFSSEEIAAEKRARQAALQREISAVQTRIERANRRNEQLFNRHSHQAFGRLYHEAFHGYLENHVFEKATLTIPRWLNEGLAQVFEHGQLDGDHLRIDSPPPELLRGLRADLNRSPLSLAEVLTATASQFHGRRDEATATRLYYYSWGLAHYLVFQRGHSIEDMLDKLRAANDPIAGLKSVTGLELEALEREWHEFVTQLGSPSERRQ